MKRLLFYCFLALSAFCLTAYTSPHNMKYFHLEMFGAVGDGCTNNAIAFRRLVEAVNANGGGRIVFPPNKVYCVAVDNDMSAGNTMTYQPSSVALLFKDCNNVIVDLNGSTIKMIPNHSTRYALIMFSGCRNYAVRNGTFIGDACMHEYAGPSSHEWGHGIISGGSVGVIEGIRISGMIGDGIYCGSVREGGRVYHSKTQILDCEIFNCRRNGITLTSSKGVSVKNTRIYDIGEFAGVQGANPQSGIDVEYEDSVYDEGNIVIDGCIFEHCTKYGITSSNSFKQSPESFILANSNFICAPLQINNISRDSRKRIENCSFTNSFFMAGVAEVNHCHFKLGDHITYITNTNFKDCDFQGTLISDNSSEYGCTFAGYTSDMSVMENCVFRNIKGNMIGNVVFQGFSGYLFPLNVQFVGCKFYNCSFCRGGSGKNSMYYFKDCSLEEGCELYSLDNEAIIFDRCSLVDVGAASTKSAHFIFNGCKIVQKDKSVMFPLLLHGSHEMNSCSIDQAVGYIMK